MSAMEDAAALVAWAAPNTAALVDEKVDQAVLQAFSGPLPAEYAMGVPLLRFAAEGVPAMPLLDAVMQEPLPRHDSQSCDRCGDSKRTIPDRLWIPSGASVVVVALCWSCKACVYEHTGKTSSLVWS